MSGPPDRDPNQDPNRQDPNRPTQDPNQNQDPNRQDPNRQNQDPNRPDPNRPDPNRPDPNRRQFPPHWRPEDQPQYGPGYNYPPPPTDYYSYPQHPHPPPPHMAMHAPPPQDQYRLPPVASPSTYREPYGPPAVVYQAAAPRQRTAIACRYCRRRKIRCSGFESSNDGRCSNCIRFNQECMFTPVSSQAQAFVPAHAAYPHLRNHQHQHDPRGPPVTLYGAHGQPLPPQHGPESTLPPPQGMYLPYGPPLAPPNPDPRQRRGSASGSDYPDPTNLAPVTTNQYPLPNTSSPYYPSPDRRTSPQSAYYDSRHSSSPHGSPYPPIIQQQPPLQPLQRQDSPQTRHSPQQTQSIPQSQQQQIQPQSAPQPAHQAEQKTPAVDGTSTPSRGGLNVRDILNPDSSRSSTDSDMLNALNRRQPDK
ncbi:hypothetical protein N7495_007491 [Penicillium taxi]|uniref:uncharacterized protein n=1 Tax=Penicillium taxi TaxID=168475 RepID=UPI0025450A84|nr:uncharacterized protein N7495_007491 [Penicillium taxi]KAJ5887450.1 hypothetical protein N7495_007491 [Penicillium taxi]